MNDQISFASNRSTIQRFKIVLIGDQNVGKSSIIGRYTRNQFDPTKNPTIGIDFISKNIAVGGRMIRLQLWDTAGQQRFKSLIPSYLRDAHLAMVVFDLSNQASVENLNKWIDFIRECGKTEIQIYIVGNKNDLTNDISNEGRKIAQDIAEKQAQKYKQVSAKSANGIEELFKDILDSLVGNLNQRKRQNVAVKNEQKEGSKQSPTESSTVQGGNTISLGQDQKKKGNKEVKQDNCCSMG